jgi:hypothetical protein
MEYQIRADLWILFLRRTGGEEEEGHHNDDVEKFV